MARSGQWPRRSLISWATSVFRGKRPMTLSAVLEVTGPVGQHQLGLGGGESLSHC